MAVWARQKFARLAKGFLGRRKNTFVVQVRGVFKALQYQYIWRRLRRRVVKQNYIRKINAGAKDLDVSYSRLIYGLNRSNIQIDRKILSEIAQYEPYSFKAVVDEIKSQVKLPLLYNNQVSYEEALERGLLYKGEYKQVEFRDIHARLIMPKEGTPDYFGVTRPDYPYFVNELEAKYNKQFMKIKQMKRLPADYYDDIEEDDSDDEFKY